MIRSRTAEAALSALVILVVGLLLLAAIQLVGADSPPELRGGAPRDSVELRSPGGEG
jgi:hypothetical protein